MAAIYLQPHTSMSMLWLSTVWARLIRKVKCLLEETKKIEIRQWWDQIFYFGSTLFSMFRTVKLSPKSDKSCQLLQYNLICIWNELGKQPSENWGSKRSIYNSHWRCDDTAFDIQIWEMICRCLFALGWSNKQPKGIYFTCIYYYNSLKGKSSWMFSTTQLVE